MDIYPTADFTADEPMVVEMENEFLPSIGSRSAGGGGAAAAAGFPADADSDVSDADVGDPDPVGGDVHVLADVGGGVVPLGGDDHVLADVGGGVVPAAADSPPHSSPDSPPHSSPDSPTTSSSAPCATATPTATDHQFSTLAKLKNWLLDMEKALSCGSTDADQQLFQLSKHILDRCRSCTTWAPSSPSSIDESDAATAPSSQSGHTPAMLSPSSPITATVDADEAVHLHFNAHSSPASTPAAEPTPSPNLLDTLECRFILFTALPSILRILLKQQHGQIVRVQQIAPTTQQHQHQLVQLDCTAVNSLFNACVHLVAAYLHQIVLSQSSSRIQLPRQNLPKPTSSSQQHRPPSFSVYSEPLFLLSKIFSFHLPVYQQLDYLRQQQQQVQQRQDPMQFSLPFEDGSGDVWQFVSVDNAESWNMSPSFLRHIETFGKLGGFQSLIAVIGQDMSQDMSPPSTVINEADSPIYSCPAIPTSIATVKLLLKPIVKVREALSQPFFVDLVKDLEPVLISRVLGLSNAQLKNEHKSILVSVCNQYQQLVQVLPEIAAKADSFRLVVADKCFKSPYLDKRLFGLSEIRELVQYSLRRLSLDLSKNPHHPVSSRIHSVSSPSVTSMRLTQGLLELKIVETLFGDAIHPELIRRSQEIIRLLAVQGRLSEEHLALIWESSVDKHETVSSAVYSVLSTLPESLGSTEETDFLFRKISSLPVSSFSVSFLNFVYQFTVSTFKQQHDLRIHCDDRKYHGLDFFWSLMQDSALVSIDLSRDAATLFQNLMISSLSFCFPACVRYFEECIKNLENHCSVPQSISVMMKITSCCSAKNIRSDILDSSVESFFSSSDSLDVVLEDLLHYMRHARSVVSAMNTSLDASELLVEKLPHRIHRDERLRFLNYFLSQSTLSLNESAVQSLWKCLISDPVTYEDQEEGFKYFTDGICSMRSFSEEAVWFLFLQKITELPVHSLSLPAYTFFEFLLRYVNFSGLIFHSSSTVMATEDQNLSQLVGIDHLWKILLEVCVDDVVETAITTLKNLLMNSTGHLEREMDSFVRHCMDHLGRASEAHASNPGDLSVVRSIHRILKLLMSVLHQVGKSSESALNSESAVPHGFRLRKKMEVAVTDVSSGTKHSFVVFVDKTLKEFTDIVASKLRVSENSLRFILGGKQLKGDALTLRELNVSSSLHCLVNKSGQDSVPSRDAKQNRGQISKCFSDHLAQFHSQLFDLLSIKSECVCQLSWELINALPTDATMLMQFVSLQEAEADPPDWAFLMDTSSIYKLMYSLVIVHSLAYGIEESKDFQMDEWRKQFCRKGGLSCMISMIMRFNFKNYHEQCKYSVCLVVILEIIHSFLLEVSGKIAMGELASSGYSAEIFVRRLIRIIGNSASLPTEKYEQFSGGVNLSIYKDRAEVVVQAMQLFVATCLTRNDILSGILKDPSFENWVIVSLIKCGDRKIRITVADGFKCLCLGIPELSTSQPHNFLLEKLLAFLPQIPPDFPTADSFMLLNWLVNRSCDGFAGASAMQFASLLRELVVILKSHPIIEQRGTENEDEVLIVLLALITTLVKKEASFRTCNDTSGLVDEVFHRCLFDIPTNTNHGALAPPKCKTKRSRKHAFELLTEVCRENYENFWSLTEKLIVYNEHAKVLTAPWNYAPSEMEKASSGYVGLRNQGATCYMNSLLQQTYMVPAFRRSILAVRFEVEEPSRSLLYQLQTLFGYLLESERKFVETKDLTYTIVGDDGNPVNVYMQMDVDEFCAQFFDKLERELKGTNEANILDKLFGGKIVNQVKSKECEHVSESREGFLTLPVDLQNKKNMYESLECYIEPAVLEGDNKYKCEKCQKKVDALRRTCIDFLPETLIVHCKRIEFDLMQMKRIKINDYYEFPMTLNLEDFTKEGIAKKEGNTHSFSAKDHPPFYYEYDLVGIIVHTGTSESGHYYSFVRERVLSDGDLDFKWFQFNDSSVEPFDPKNIPAQCYGGVETTSVWDKVNQTWIEREMPKVYSAYMLFYQRRGLQLTTETNLVSLIPEDIYKSVWDHNMDFLYDKNIFDVDYFQHVFSILRLGVPTAGAIADSDPFEDIPSDPVRQVIRLGTSFFFEILIRSKEKNSNLLMNNFVMHLKTLYARHLPSSKWVLEEIMTDPRWITSALFHCASEDVRVAAADLLVHVISLLFPYDSKKYSISEDHDEIMSTSSDENVKQNPLLPKFSGVSQSIAVRFMDEYCKMLPKAYPHWRNFAEYFKVIEDFSHLGFDEKCYFLSRNMIARLIDFFLADASPYSKYNLVKKRMGDKAHNPSLGHLVGAIASILSAVDDLKFSCSDQVATPTLSKMDLEMLGLKIFYEKALQENQNGKALVEIALFVCLDDVDMSFSSIDLVVDGIDKYNYKDFHAYFEFLTPLLGLEDTLKDQRAEYFMSKYVPVICKYMNLEQATRISIQYLLEHFSDVPRIRSYLLSSLATWVPVWLIAADYESVREVASKLLNEILHCSNDSAEQEIHFQQLLSFLPQCKRHVQRDRNTVKLVQYARTLTRCLKMLDCTKIFKIHCDDFFAVLQHINALQYCADRNKLEMILLLHEACLMDPEVVNLTLRHSDFLYRYQMNINQVDPVLIKYNNDSLPPYFQIVLLCCRRSSDFFERMINQDPGRHTMMWAIDYLFARFEYIKITGVMSELVRLICNHSSGKTMRKKIINIGLEGLRSSFVMKNCLQLLLFSLQNVDEAIYFSQLSGFWIIAESIHQVSRGKKPLTDCLSLQIAVLRKSVSLMSDDRYVISEGNGSWLENWKNRDGIVESLFHLYHRASVESHCHQTSGVAGVLESILNVVIILSENCFIFLEQTISFLPLLLNFAKDKSGISFDLLANLFVAFFVRIGFVALEYMSIRGSLFPNPLQESLLDLVISVCLQWNHSSCLELFLAMIKHPRFKYSLSIESVERFLLSCLVFFPVSNQDVMDKMDKIVLNLLSEQLAVLTIDKRDNVFEKIALGLRERLLDIVESLSVSERDSVQNNTLFKNIASVFNGIVICSQHPVLRNAVVRICGHELQFAMDLAADQGIGKVSSSNGNGDDDGIGVCGSVKAVTMKKLQLMLRESSTSARSTDSSSNH